MRALIRIGTRHRANLCRALVTNANDTKYTKRKGFGSFQSASVEELIRLPHSEYIAPEAPFEREEWQTLSTDTEFGSTLKGKLFLLDGSWTFINHGAFGASAKEVELECQAWRMHLERQPLRFIDRELLPHLAHTVRALSQFVDASPTDLVLLPNATAGLNAVIRSLVDRVLSPGDEILLLDTAYVSVKKMVRVLCAARGITIREVCVPFPLESEEQAIRVVENALTPRTRLAIFDHITSGAGLVLPVKRLTEICQRAGAQVLIDGAHALGSLDLSVNSIGADYYVSNAHKWLCCPRGAAFLHVLPQHNSIIRPSIIANGYGDAFLESFIWDGARDYSSAVAMPTALKLWHKLGRDRCRAYMETLVKQSAKDLVNRWKSHDAVMICENMLQGPMALVPLPLALAGVNSDWIQHELHFRHQIEVPVKTVGGRLHVRISAHVYNCKEDYQRLGEAIEQLVKRGGFVYL